jgi:hypothetical protein
MTPHKRALFIALSVLWVTCIGVSPVFGQARIITGAGQGGLPEVKVFDAGQNAIRDFSAYSAGFTGGVRVGSGDVNGDGIADIITGAGPGGGPDVRVFDGTTGTLLQAFFAFSSNFTGGVYVAGGDVNKDGKADIIVGAGQSGGPEVKVFNGTNLSLMQDFFAFAPSFTGGVRVGSGDINKDGVFDIITGAGPGGGPEVKVFDGTNGTLLQDFFAFNPNFTGGVYVAGGDVNGDGAADIIVGAGAGGGPEVKVFDGTSGTLLQDFFAFAPNFTGGVSVGSVDLNGDGFADIIAAVATAGGPEVRVFDGQNLALLADFFAYSPNFTGGVFVAGSNPNAIAPAAPVTPEPGLLSLLAGLGIAGSVFALRHRPGKRRNREEPLMDWDQSVICRELVLPERR